MKRANGDKSEEGLIRSLHKSSLETEFLAYRKKACDGLTAQPEIVPIDTELKSE
jgi:hypothetical protein